MVIKAKHIFISGRVQGVGYRNFSAVEATTHNLRGWVRNLEDGRVELMVTGLNSAGLEEFLVHLKKGPPMGLVTEIDVKEAELNDEDLSIFKVLDDSEEQWRPKK